MRKSSRLFASLVGVPLLLGTLLPGAPVSASSPVQILLDGRLLTLDPAPTIVDGRTLVPVRGLFEAMDGTVTWDGTDRSVEVIRSGRYVKLRIGRRMACLETDCSTAATMDVPAQIIGDRTFVPVRFVTQAMGARVSWDNEQRAVVIDTQQQPDYQFSNLSISSLVPFQVVNGPIPLQATGAEQGHIQFYLFDPDTLKGPIVAAGNDPTASYTYTPDPTITGLRLLVAGVRDSTGAMHYSDPISLQMTPSREVRVTGADWNGVVDGPITFGNEVNFAASHVSYQLIDPPTGSVERLGTAGPGDRLTWYPQVGHNGPKRLQVVAVGQYGNEYPSEQIPIQVNSGYRTSFSGLSQGSVLTRSVNLQIATNYSVASIQYLLNDNHLAWGTNYWWNFGPEMNGDHSLQVVVTDTDGVRRMMGPYDFTISTTPQLRISGVGPNEVLTDSATLRGSSNVAVSTIEYHLTNPATGQSKRLGSTSRWGALDWTPVSSDEGQRRLHAVAITENGERLSSEAVSFRVYLGQVYGPEPLVAQSEFKQFASSMAVPSYRATGMSAALQVAQAILETGWGQFVPVDKYSGQLSNNLFGIKGTGPAGSVISNTWEEYNGVAYRVDDYFRAYHNVSESWADHKDLLLTRSWYAPFRAVMADPVMGAWGLRRSGYATDSQYPIKLITIMRQNDLFRLDEVEL